MTNIDALAMKEKYSHYEHRIAKLDKKDNEFSTKKFQKVRKDSKHKNLLKSLDKIGICLNEKPAASISIEDLNKVCFLLINDYHEEDKKLGVGPLNDGYLVALNHFRLGYKIYYLYNSRSDEFPIVLGFLIKHTKESLTVFYTGRDDNAEGIEFKTGHISKSFITDVIKSNYNEKSRTVFIADSIGKGSVFNVDDCANIISFSAKKPEPCEYKDIEQSHGIFTYYICKIISEYPNITPNELVERLNLSLVRFNEKFTYKFSNKKLAESPIFIN